jgi:polyhydroxyalkanoate synthase
MTDQPKNSDTSKPGKSTAGGSPFDASLFDPSAMAGRSEEWVGIMAGIAERSQRLVSDFIARNSSKPSQTTGDLGMAESLRLGTAFIELTTKMLAEPNKLMDAQLSLWRDYMGLWRSTALKVFDGRDEPVIAPEPADRRFKDEAWQENQVFDFIKQSYLLTSRWIQATVHDVDGLDSKTKRKVDFFTKQFIDAIAPTNFALTNPEVLRAVAETKGENLVKGLEHLLADLEKGKGRLRVSMTNEDAFDVGVNIAATPGKVVFQNRMLQLIQYSPTTDEVKETPIVIMPPWINKFYILDLRPQNSLLKWLTDQGYTTFVVSWVNPDASMSDVTFENYMLEGSLAVKDAVLAATGAKKLHMVGYCLGGTLLAATLAYLKAKGDDSVASATYFVTMTDFKEAGDLGVFVDEEQIKGVEKRMADSGGYLDAADMATTFNLLRSNDLIWSFVVNNYLMGKEPFPFDLLYWNSDSTRMPQAMHSYYLRNMYLENNLSKPGGIVLNGVPIDLGAITVPSYMLSCREDHIAPWASTFEGTKLFSGATRFVLAGSGHIAGVINPPAGKKYNYWTNDKKTTSAEDWLKTAQEHPGSWWPDWDAWLAPKSGKMVPARKPGTGKSKAIENAPGSYVKFRAV